MAFPVAVVAIGVLMSAADLISSARVSAAVRSALFCRMILVVFPMLKAASRSSTRLGCGSRLRLSDAASETGRSMAIESTKCLIVIFVKTFYHSDGKFGWNSIFRNRLLSFPAQRGTCTWVLPLPFRETRNQKLETGSCHPERLVSGAKDL